MSFSPKSIRLAVEPDTDQIRAIYEPIVEQTYISFEYSTPDASELWERIQKTLDQWPWLVCEVENVIAGFAYASHHRSRTAYQWCAELSVYVDPRFQNRKIARALYMTLIEILKMQGYYNAYAGIALPNPVSVAFHEGLGFTKIGEYTSIGHKLGKWHNVGWWELNLQPYAEDPDKPKPLPRIIDQPKFSEILKKGTDLIKDI